jgi:hypothetical protein
MVPDGELDHAASRHTRYVRLWCETWERLFVSADRMWQAQQVLTTLPDSYSLPAARKRRRDGRLDRLHAPAPR